MANKRFQNGVNTQFGAFMSLKNAKPVMIYANVSSGDNDVYTAPSGRKCIFQSTTNVHIFYNTSGSSITWYTQIKIGGTYYRTNTNRSTSAGASSSSGMFSAAILLDPEEILSFNTNGSGNMWIFGVEFDSDDDRLCCAKKYSSWSSGDNTILTVPDGKTACTVSGFNGTHMPGLFIYNTSGSTLTWIHYIVPNGGSPGSTNQIAPSATVTTSNIGVLSYPPNVIGPQSSLVLNVNQTSGLYYQYVYWLF